MDRRGFFAWCASVVAWLFWPARIATPKPQLDLLFCTIRSPGMAVADYFIGEFHGSGSSLVSVRDSLNLWPRATPGRKALAIWNRESRTYDLCHVEIRRTDVAYCNPEEWTEQP